MKLLSFILFFTTFASYGQGQTPEKLGVGIVAVFDTYNPNRFVTIYRDKGLKVKMEDFRMYGQSTHIHPYYFKPDYGHCYFVCMQKDISYFKVLINEHEVGYLRNDHDTYFKTWESILINAGVERLDIKSNPLREKPVGSAKPIVLDYEMKIDRLIVIDVIETSEEDWTKVYYSKSGKLPCEQGTPDCGEGWIMWRRGDKLLVNILLLD